MPKIISNLKEELMIKGKEILINDGYNALNIRDLAKRCNIGIGTFYNYYESKDIIVSAIIRTDWDKVINLTGKKIKESDFNFKEKLHILYNGINEFLEDYLDTFMVMMTDRSRNPSYKTDKILVPYENIVKEVLIFHKNNKDISYEIEDEKLARIILNNIIFICRDSSISFEDFYLSLNININNK